MRSYILSILVICILGSGTALAGFGETSSSKADLASVPVLGASIAPAGAEQQQEDLLASSQSAPAASTQSAPPQSQQQKLLAYDSSAGRSTSVYYNGNFVGWTSFASTFPRTVPMFWIATSQGWSWYASMPLGQWAQMLMYIPTAGPLKVYEIYPSGWTQMSSFGFASQGYNYIWFNADVSGRHIILFAVGDQPSNAVMIDVSSRSIPPSPPPGAITVGDTFTKALSSNPSTGYQWKTEFNQNVIQLVDQRYEQGSSIGTSIGSQEGSDIEINI